MFYLEEDEQDYYTTECLSCGINVTSTYLQQMGQDNDTAKCPTCLELNSSVR